MKKSKIDILHVYAGTSGSAGLYLDEIYNALKNDFKQVVIVSYYFPFEYGKKIFYRWSDMSTLKPIKSNKIRYIIRFIELSLTLTRIFFLLLTLKVLVLNYNLTSDLKIEYLFILLVKSLTNTKIVITCHDVIPFHSTFISSSKQIERKRSFFNLSDFLLVHNKNSIDELKNYFGIKPDKIINFPFPIMDLNRLQIKDELGDWLVELNKEKEIFRIGAIGHFRKEKGLEILIEAWNKFFKEANSSKLIIAGHIPKNCFYDLNSLANKNVAIYEGFINDMEFRQVIELCDLIVMPYTQGTNSGIPSSILSMHSLVLTSDIEMFRNNELVCKDFQFKSGDPNDLGEKLNWVYNLPTSSINDYRLKNDKKINEYKSNFRVSVIKSTRSIFGFN